MKLHNPTADIFVPDGKPVSEALKRITHLGIGAHQDDLEFMCLHGILDCFQSDAKWFTGVTVTDGTTASFSVTASGTPPFTYQWQVSADGLTLTLQAAGEERRSAHKKPRIGGP